MKVKLTALLFLFLGNCLFAQKKSNRLQFFPFVRVDWYPEFSYNVGGRPSTDYLKMRGISPGINVNYKFGLQKNVDLITGLGFYKFSFNKLFFAKYLVN